MKIPPLRILPVLGASIVAFFLWAALFDIDQTVRTQG